MLEHTQALKRGREEGNDWIAETTSSSGVNLTAIVHHNAGSVMMVTCLTMALLMCLLSSVATASSSTRNLRAHGRLQERDVLLTSQQEFIDQCTVSLLSDDAVDDDLISQDEFTQFLSGYCIQQAICDPGSTLDFTNLSVELQLAFVMFICNEPMEVEREQCLDELKNSGDSFGYFLQIEEREVLDTEIAELCAQAYLHSIRSGLLLSPTTLGMNDNV